MQRTAYTELIRSTANVYGIDANLLEAVVIKESSGNPWAWNPEPAYRYLWDVRKGRPFRPLTSAEVRAKFPPADFPALVGDSDHEWWGQQASWGLLQLMGAVARELGYKAPYLPSLCNPATNLTWGAKHLSARLQWAGGDKRTALAGYNAGTAGGPTGALARAGTYPDKVLAIYAQLLKL